MIEVIVFGVGCSLCRHLLGNVQMASKQLGLEVDVREVADIQEMINLGITAIPALSIDGKIVASGQVPNVSDIIHFLQEWP
ncbi:MAG: thioredoxin family protein [Phaeodactylibacter sp.]|nr:thioredoxin family protein [Phaeodactylibacter sp.]MCB9274582.1 thioredoxin family protein [Lewinellaceae bacterium]